MQGQTYRTGVSLLVIAVFAYGSMASAGTAKPAVAPPPSHQELKDKPSSYGASGAQGVFVGQGEIKTPPLKTPCPEGAVTVDHPNLPDAVIREAHPNQCYTRLMKPPVLETYVEKVMVQPERVETRTVPEEWRWAERKIEVTPERVERKTIPAVTRKVREDRVVQEAGWREESVPPVYEKRRETVMVRPSRQEWVASEGVATGAAMVTPGDHEAVRYRADGLLTWPGKEPVVMQADPETTEYLQKGSAQTVWCLKDIPAEYKTVERTFEVRPATVRRVRVPARVERVERVIIEREEQVVEKVIPATYRTEKYKEVTAPARTESRTVPAVYDMVKKTRAVQAPEPVWREVLCERNATPAKVREIQTALKQRGYDPGPVDGTLGTKTVAAMQKFQADQGLPQGQISVEAAEALGVKIR